ncbi:MAG: FRG domain-containing protein [Anaeroplasma sp.]
MKPIKEIQYESWVDFKTNIYDDLEEICKDSYLFRGLSNENYELISTFDRLFSTKTYEERNRIFNSIVDDFFNSCSQKMEKIEKLDESGKIAFARHYGLPTRYLDWSKSIYVAAFFAFASIDMQDMDGHVVIYALDKTANIINEVSGIKIVMPKNDYNYRQYSQQGAYTVLNSFHKSIEDFLLNAMDLIDKPVLYKIYIPKSEFYNALKDLNFMNISYKTLQDDFEGYARTAVLNYMINSHYNN